MDDASASASPKPSRFDITAEMIELDLVPSPAAGELLLQLAVTELHTWLGIGGRTGRVRRPRLLSRKIPLSLSSPRSLHIAGCRRLVTRAMMDEFLREEWFADLSAANWDQAVPWGMEARIAERARALPTNCAGRCVVTIRVVIEFVYCEAAALLSSCVSMAAAGDDAGTAPPSSSSSCPICLEDMARDATRLPGCGHGFHAGCIGNWFKKTSTCPLCRRDKFQYLPPDYRAVHDEICSYDGLSSDPNL
ncbi:hypothetical protein BS78_03G392400 [Paspalum vaginatum]|nr:hypothetical protein BS78_03G392400 [Paspalum vaginatum]